jgi:hypothetical protein
MVDLYPDSTMPLIASIDDTNLRKTGTRVPGVSYRRDPMSPPFQANLIRAQRFVQASLIIPFQSGPSACRAIPVAFDHAPSGPKPRAKATEQERRACRLEQKEKTLSSWGVKTIKRLRGDLDQAGATNRLLLSGDGSYTNRTILQQLPERTDFIGRLRKDAVLHALPTSQPGRGRPRLYGERLSTPEQIRQDESIPWKSIRVFAAGREHQTEIKEVTPILWRKAGVDLPLRLIIIRPLAYRRSQKQRVRYRDPAYLITTNLTLPVDQIVQAYLWRWDIEVNHRDEKQLIGVGQAQVRSQKSAERVPAFAVATYSMLLIAAAHAFGLDASDPVQPLPKWLSPSAQRQIRIPTTQLLGKLRSELMASRMNLTLPNFDHFASRFDPYTTSLKGAKSNPDTLTAPIN